MKFVRYFPAEYGRLQSMAHDGHENCKNRAFLVFDEARGQIWGQKWDWSSEFSQKNHTITKNVVLTSTEDTAPWRRQLKPAISDIWNKSPILAEKDEIQLFQWLNGLFLCIDSL